MQIMEYLQNIQSITDLHYNILLCLGQKIFYFANRRKKGNVYYFTIRDRKIQFTLYKLNMGVKTDIMQADSKSRWIILIKRGTTMSAKRSICIVLSLILTFSLIGCDTNKNSPANISALGMNLED